MLSKCTVDGSESLHQLRWVVYPIIYRVLYVQKVVIAGFLPSTVSFEFTFKAPWQHWIYAKMPYILASWHACDGPWKRNDPWVGIELWEKVFSLGLEDHPRTWFSC